MLNRLLGLAAGSSLPHVITNASAEVIYANEAFKDVCGHSLPELEGKHVGNVLRSPNTSEQVILETREKLNKGVPFQFRTVNRHANGNDYRVGIYIIPFLHGDQSELHYVAISKVLRDDEKDLLAHSEASNAAKAIHSILIS